MPSPACTLNFKLVDTANNPVKGKVVLTLDNYGPIIPHIANTVTFAKLVYPAFAASDGTGTVTFWGNFETTTPNSYFQIAVYGTDSQGNVSNSPSSTNNYRFTTAGTFDLNSLTPISSGSTSPIVVTPPQAVLLNPTSIQSIATYGLEGPWFGSESTNIAQSGNLRLAKTDTIDWRNNANSADLGLGINGSDQLIFNGSPVTISFSPPYINVKAYGATGNGVTDDTTAIQNAINACTATTGLVYFPAGTYLISSGLTFGKYFLTMFGDSVSNTSIDTTSSFNGTMLTPTSLTADLVGLFIHDITFNGAGQTSAHTVNGLNIAVAGHDIVRLMMLNVQMSNMSGDAFTGSVVIVSSFINCQCQSIGGNGFKLINGGTSVSFISCYANAVTLSGYDLTAYYYCSFTNCACDSSGVAYYLHNCQTITFTGCGCESLVYDNASFPGTGWWLDNCFNCTLINGYSIAGNVGSGNAANITLHLSSNSAKNTIIGLKADYNNGGTLPTWGIVLEAATGQNTFINVDLNDNGINLGGTAGTHDIGGNENLFQEGLTITNPGGSQNAFTVTDEIIGEILTAVGPAGTSIISVAQTGDTNPRIIMTNNDGLYYTSGSAGVDAQLSRYSPGVLSALGTLGGGISISAYGDTYSRFSFQNDNGGIFFGPGTVPGDTTVSRSGGAGIIGIGTTGYGDTSGTLVAATIVAGRKAPAIAAGVLTIDASTGNTFEILLNQNVTSSSIINPRDGQVIRILWVQDATGGWTVAFPANLKGGTAPSATLNLRSCQEFVYSSNQVQWFAVATGVTGM